jgi:hypothetical protein
VAIGLAVAAGILVVAALIAGSLLDEERVAGSLSEAVTRETDGAYSLAMDELELDVLAGRVVATGVHLIPDTARRGGHVTVKAASVDVRGVNRWTLLASRRLRARELRIGSPELVVTTEDDEAEEGDEDTRASLVERLAETLADGPPALSIGRVAITDGRVAWSNGATATGIELEADDFVLSAEAANDTSRVLFTRTLEVSAQAFHRVDADSLHVVQVGPLRLVSADSTLAADSLDYVPTVAEEEFRRRARHRQTRYQIQVGDIRTESFDVRRFLHAGAVHARLVSVTGASIELFVDKTMPSGPPEPAVLPHQRFQRIDRSVRLDSVRLDSTRLVHQERAEDGVRPGRLVFAPISGVITNLTNDPALNTAASPTILEATTRIEGQGPLRATIRFPLLSTTFDPSFEGTMESMHAPALNVMLEPLDGITIESGNVRSIRFEGRTRNGVASGTLTAIYDDLSVKIFDKKDGSQSLGQWIETFATDNFLLRDSNLPADGGQPPEVGTIEWTRPPDQKFFAFLWASLRSGILSQIGI